MAKDSGSTGIARTLSRRLLPLAVLIGLFLGLGAPMTFWVLEHRNLKHATDLYAGDLAKKLADLALDAPALWKYQTYKFLEIVKDFHPVINVADFNVLDEKGIPISGFSYKENLKRKGGGLTFLEEFTLTRGVAPIIFNNHQVGTVEVLTTDTRINQSGLLLFTLSALVGTTLTLLFFRFPVEVVRKLEKSQNELADIIQQSERKYRSLINNIPDVVWTSDPERKTVFISPRLEKVYGFTADEVCSSGHALWFGRIHPDDQELVRKSYAEFFATGNSYDVEYRVQRKDGEWIWLHDRATETYEIDGVKYADGLFTDISASKEIEKELREMTLFLKRVMDSLPEAISIINVSDYRIIGCNAVFCADVKMSEAEALGKLCFELTHHRSEPCSLPDDFCPLMETMETGKYAMAEHRHPLADGRSQYVEISSSPIFDENNRMSKVVHVARDVTARRRSEEVLAEQARELTRSNAELEQFAYVASHDLQEPLRMIASYMQLLSRRYQGKLDADADEFIVFAVDGANRLQRLINDLLLYSRVGSQGRKHHPVDCNLILQFALDNLQVAIKEGGAEIVTTPLPIVSGDAGQLLQLLQNLIANAVKFRSTEPPRVEVKAQRQGKEWLFSVRDNGIGIETKNFTRIFQIFQRLHDRTTYSGTGIGLALCKKIVEQHGGRIWVEPAPGKGITFLFTLPAQGDVQ